VVDQPGCFSGWAWWPSAGLPGLILGGAAIGVASLLLLY
jgi:hypothetical protein